MKGFKAKSVVWSPLRRQSGFFLAYLEYQGRSKPVKDIADIAHEGKAAAPVHQQERQVAMGAMTRSRRSR